MATALTSGTNHQRMELLLIEHINLCIMDIESSRLFFEDGLGCKENPSGKAFVHENYPGSSPQPKPWVLAIGEQRQMHYNCGPLTQFHLSCAEWDGKRVRTPQIIQGYVTVMFDDLDSLLLRLRGIQHLLQGTRFSFVEAKRQSDQARVILVNEPNGNLIIAEQAPPGARDMLLEYGSHTGGCGNAIGIREIAFYCKIGNSAKIAQFYERTFGADVHTGQVDVNTGQFDRYVTKDSPYAQTMAIKETICSVIEAKLPNAPKNLWQTIRYVESDIARPENSYDLDPGRCGFHLCIYVKNYEKSTRLASLRNLFWVNPRFSGPPFYDTVMSEHEALLSQQYRIKDVPGFVLEHEVRGIGHDQCPLRAYHHPDKPVPPFGRVICQPRPGPRPLSKL